MKFSEIKELIKTELVDTQIVCATTLTLEWLDKQPTEEEFNALCALSRSIYSDVDSEISIGKITDVVSCAYYGKYYYDQPLFDLKNYKKGLSTEIYNKIYNQLF